MRRVIPLLLLLLGLPLAPSEAQTLRFSVAAPGWEGGNPRLEVEFAEVPHGGTVTGLRLAAGRALELGIRLRESQSFASVGTFTLELGGDAATDGRYALAGGARGVAGPLALRVRASIHDGIEPPAPLPLQGPSGLPILGPGPAIYGLEVGTTYRASRTLVLLAAPAVFVRDGAAGARLDTELRLLRVVGDDDLLILGHGSLLPGTGPAGALGFGYALNRRRAPTWIGSVWLGAGSAGMSPGLVVSGSERTGGMDIELRVAAQPYRSDEWPYRLELELDHSIGDGELHVVGLAGLRPGEGWRGGGSVGYRMPFGP